MTPQLRADGDDYRLRMARKEVNDEIDHIYVTGARMRGEPLGKPPPMPSRWVAGRSFPFTSPALLQRGLLP